MTTDERVDVSRPSRDAWEAAETWAAVDPAYAENMAVLAELGELLDTDRRDPDYAAECRSLVDRSVALDGIQQREHEQAWALRIAQWERCDRA